ncbi:hypothetical protein A4D02_27420 [Niastella koreensis]|uniref:Nal1 C-terminal domain-containing protein n=2 Tax=Niastella koreensis TaxID=354356 RepID=G8TGX1_NIAKG|nr:hypothetical protein [Niastella koreensis]AEV99573.1 hypothetical protein Niako_3247 [Niastella koreensis GR20-10]OQP50163.1 hypothetical protein A4D02_27420 [Niastella koreensis]
MENAFQFLSLRDLLDARDAFHIHLMKKENVVATALGKYRQRIHPGTEAKTLLNTEIRKDSWPCILVFVKQWVTYDEFRNHPATDTFDNYIPSAVYLPDGRKVPICVIEVANEASDVMMVTEEELIFPSDYIGGGFPLLIESQGIERVASIGCVVSDGNKYYALTNRHVAGVPGTIVYTKVKGTVVPIGVSSGKYLGNMPFDKVYPGWTAANMITNADVGLIEINDITYWKTDIIGLDRLGSLYDLNINNLTLNLIGTPVKASGAVSGKLAGEIAGFFYRYRSVGGMDYVADLMIGPRDAAHPLNTRHGDSGTLWVTEENDTNGEAFVRPIATQWGAHCFVENGQERKYTFALATGLSIALRELDIDIVSGWNSGSDYTWGEVGHYTIANIAALLVTDTKLKKLMSNNLDLITFDQEILKKDSTIKKARKGLKYTPLADVPDLVWKIRGGKFQRSLENPNHFADMDKTDSNGQRLLDLCTGKGEAMKFLTPNEWLSYYTDPAVRDSSKGILPFRVWQIFLQMVEYAANGDATGFVSAAGVLAHYVGDACQPLHISYMFNGIPTSNGSKKGDGVHEAFEAKLVNKYNSEIISLVNTLIKQPEFQTLLTLKTGKQAAAATVELMKETFAAIQPKTIVDAFVANGSNFVDTFWKAKGKTALPKLFASCAYILASIWNSAWVLGKGGTNVGSLETIEPSEISKLYESEDFLTSTNIKGIGQFLNIKGAQPVSIPTVRKSSAKKSATRKGPGKKRTASKTK